MEHSTVRRATVQMTEYAAAGCAIGRAAAKRAKAKRRTLGARRALAAVMAFVIALAMLPGASIAAPAGQATLASWTFAGAEASPSPANGGDDVFGGTASSFSISEGAWINGTGGSSNTIYVGGWSLAKYWLIATSAVGYEDIAVAFRAYGSNTAPKNFTAEFSVDNGATWTAAGSYSLASRAAEYALSLPAAAAGADALLIRFHPTDNESVNGGVFASGGNSRMFDISVTGVKIGGSEPAKAATPTASPAPGAVTSGTSVTFASATSGAVIEYNTVAAGFDGAWTKGASATVESAVTYYVRAAADGLEPSDVAAFAYTIEEPGADVMTVAQARAASGTVTTKGVVVAIDGLSYHIQDASAGICARFSSNPGVAAGDLITVTGSRAAYSGLEQINVAEFEAHGPGVAPEPVAMPMGDIADGAAELMSQLVAINGVVTVGAEAAGQYISCVGADGAVVPVKFLGTAVGGQTITTDGEHRYVTIAKAAVTVYGNGSVWELLAVEYAVASEPEPDPDPEFETDGGGDIAVWQISAAPGSSTQSVPATGGDFAPSSVLTAVKDGAQATLGASSGSVSWSGLNGRSGDAYWLAGASSLGLANISVASAMRSSGTGPRDFKLQWSADGETWSDANETANLTAGAAAWAPLSDRTLPAGANNLPNLYVRWLLNSETSANGGTLGAGGTNQINNVVISGDYILPPNGLRRPVADATSGSIPLGRTIVFSPNPADGALEGFSALVSADGVSFEPAPGNAYTVSSLPATLYVKASADGKEESRALVLSFTQAQAAQPAASPSGGSYVTFPAVTLTAQEAGAEIWYTADGSDPKTSDAAKAYSAPIEGLALPAVIKAYAKAPGYVDSAVAIAEYKVFDPDAYSPYFGQLHAHTTYSDGAGSLRDGLSYVSGIPAEDSVDFVSFTDHSNYFDSAAAANPAGALNDKAQMTADSLAEWEDYRGAMREYNAANGGGSGEGGSGEGGGGRLAIPGFEMTWSGGPGHINTFNSDGLVSRNNAALNAKGGDAGMRLYYDTLAANQDPLANLSQFNHPGATFGTFGDFAYYNPAYDGKMIAVEVGNGEGGIGSGGYFPSYGEYVKALDKGWHVAPTNNQDNHKGLWGNANTARTVIYADEFSERGLLQGMKNLAVYTSEDKNLRISYFLNDQMMGAVIGDTPSDMRFRIDASDPDTDDAISKIEVVTNGGRVAWSETYQSNAAAPSFTLPAAQGYYFVRVTQADKNIAVTAPVWIGAAPLAGINSFEADTKMPVAGEELTLNARLFNNEAGSVTLSRVEFLANGTAIKSETPNTEIASGAYEDVSCKYTPAAPGASTLAVRAVMLIGGDEREYSASMEITALDAGKLVYLGIDASHYNEYVDGNYKASMTNLADLAVAHGVRVVELKTGEELIAASADPKYKALILTAPTRRSGSAALVGYKNYTDAELAAVAAFAKAGNTVIATGWGDFYESYEPFPAGDHMAAQQNRLLAAIGSSLRVSDDEIKDSDPSHRNDSADLHRLYLTEYNLANAYLDGVKPDEQVYSNYGGATVYAVGADGAPASALPGSVSPMVYGFESSYSADDDNDGFAGVAIPRYEGKYLVAASETVDYGGGASSNVIVAGAAFMSNFEIQASMDSYATPAYSNYTIMENILASVNPAVVSSVSAAHAGAPGERFTVRGLATSNASGFDQATAFFDCIYVQDATAGINVFPVDGDIRKGQTVEVTGTVSSYNGEIQLAAERIEVVDAAVAELPAPAVLTAAEAASGASLGSLVSVSGAVTRFTEPTSAGVAESIYVKDASGVECLVFIDGYITVDKAIPNLAVGASVTAVGLSSIGTDGPRIRVRDRADVVCSPAAEERFTLSVAAAERTEYGRKAEYVLRAENMRGVNLIAIDFEADGSILGCEKMEIAGRNDFSQFAEVKWQSLGDGRMRGKATVGVWQLGVAKDGDMDVAAMMFDTTRLGKAGVTITGVKVYGIDIIDGKAESNLRAAEIGAGAAVTLVYSRYDVNGDSRVDLADLSLAFYYFLSEAGDLNWVGGAERADTNGNGAVEIDDLSSIYANFTSFTNA